MTVTDDKRVDVGGTPVSTLHYIGGRRVGSDSTFQNRSPRTGAGTSATSPAPTTCTASPISSTSAATPSRRSSADAAILEAAEDCPMAAITVRDTHTGEVFP